MGQMLPSDSYSDMSKSYFLYIPHESLSGVEEFKQTQQGFQVNQVLGTHVESFFPSLFKKNTLHPILAWLSMLEKLLRVDFQHMRKKATSGFSSLSLAPFHFKTRGRIFCNWGRRMMQENSTNYLKHTGFACKAVLWVQKGSRAITRYLKGSII